jgi:hypothetical protein
MEMHSATKILLKLTLSLVQMTAFALIVNFVNDWVLRFLYVFMTGIGFMITDMILWPIESAERSELARTVWKKVMWIAFRSGIIAIALIGFLVSFTTGTDKFIVFEGAYIKINTSYLIAYGIAWLVMLVITNVVVGN